MRKLLLLLGLALTTQVGAENTSASSADAKRVSPFATIPLGEDKRLTLEQAWALGEQANPVLRGALAHLPAAEGHLQDSRALLWNNPVATTDLARRSATQAGAATERFNEWAVGIAQTFEVAGQHGYRREAAQLDLAAAHSNIDEVRARVRADIELAFSRVLTLQERIALERDALKVIEDAAAVVGKRVNAGEDTRLEGNLAAVEAERGRNQVTVLEEQLIQARAELAALLYLPPGAFPEVEGRLAVTAPASTLDDLLVRAANRPQLRTLELRERAAQSRLSFERAAAYPDVTVGISTGREGAIDTRERLTILTVSVPLPLFRRNATGIGRAASELTQSQLDRERTNRDVQAQVRTLWQRVESLRARVTRLSDSVLPALDENRRLSNTAYRAGEIGLLQLLLVNRQLLDARRDYMEAFSDFIQARVALEHAAGIVGTPSVSPSPAR